MSDKKKKQEEEVLVDVVSQISGIEKFIEKNQKNILTVIGGIVAVIAAFWLYNNYYQQPRETQANEEIMAAQLAFERDSLELALNGDGGSKLGFLSISEEYSGTKAANLSHYYAGVCYLNLKKYAEAIKELDQFNAKDEVFASLSNSAMGDAFNELNQPQDALDFYEKAVAGGNNEFLAPFIHKKAGMTADLLGNHAKAIKHYQAIKDKYPNSREASDIAKYIARSEAKMQ